MALAYAVAKVATIVMVVKAESFNVRTAALSAVRPLAIIEIV